MACLLDRLAPSGNSSAATEPAEGTLLATPRTCWLCCAMRPPRCGLLECAKVCLPGIYTRHCRLVLSIREALKVNIAVVCTPSATAQVPDADDLASLAGMVSKALDIMEAWVKACPKQGLKGISPEKPLQPVPR